MSIKEITQRFGILARGKDPAEYIEIYIKHIDQYIYDSCGIDFKRKPQPVKKPQHKKPFTL